MRLFSYNIESAPRCRRRETIENEHMTTNPKPVRALGAEAQTLELEADARLAWSVLVVNALLVAFLGEAQQ